jgi:seryl-tRNA synthetase
MIDLGLLRDRPDEVIDRLGTRGVPRSEVEALIEADAAARSAVARRDEARAELNRLSERIGELRRGGKDATELQSQARALGDKLRTLEQEAAELTSRRDDLWLVLPNLPSREAPLGTGEEDNRPLRYWSPLGGHRQPEEFELPAFADHQRVPHWEIGSALGILDFERATKLSGAMFAMYRGQGARLVRVLTSFALDAHTEAFEEIRPPTVVRRATMQATGHLPKFADEAYAIERDDLYLIPTAEVPLTSLGRDEILPEAALPMRFCAYTPCFRREAGAAGKDTRGLLRLHEFDKVELLGYCTPDQAPELFLEVLGRAEWILQQLGLTYRVVDLCTGDLGQSSARTFDLEVYSPALDRWLEVSSVSVFTDYQARRANIRYRRADGTVGFVWTVNGSALAWGRVIAALLEQGHQPGGEVLLPTALHARFGSDRLTSPRAAAAQAE